ncbi:Haemolysin-type calcium binding protein related domain [Serratia fonticola]|uniref:Haemolysin-type calcium binding protein related domain n=1 Tax=Serratia fonticola TaxID=47917 RepID=A0A4U9W1N4_SERFO|nr:Haemolysin-type calcium binding protein related domain [Serratia fonticola]
MQFGKGITHDMIGFTRSKYDLIVTVGDKGDQMTFRGFFTNSSRQTFTRFEFADKSVWGNIKESKTWKESIDKPAYSANDMPRPASSFGLESSVANQANSLLTAMATFAPQEGGIGFLPENNAQSAPILVCQQCLITDHKT